MIRHWHVLAVGVILGLALVAFTGSGQAADDEKEFKEAREPTLKIADLIAAKKNDDAKKAAADFAKKLDDWKDVGKAMKTMALRDNFGVGFGPPEKKFSPDGIEAKIISLGRRPLSAKDMGEQADALTRSGNIASACAEIALAKPPAKKSGKKNPDDWKKWAQEMKEAAADFSAAAAKKDPDALKQASIRLNSSCTDCHAIFKEK